MIANVDPSYNNQRDAEGGNKPLSLTPDQIKYVAEKVYRLLLADARLARARGALLSDPEER